MHLALLGAKINGTLHCFADEWGRKLRTGERRTRPESRFCKALLPYFSRDVVAVDALLLQEHVKTALVLSQGMTSNSEKGTKGGKQKKTTKKNFWPNDIVHIFIISFLLLALTSDTYVFFLYLVEVMPEVVARLQKNIHHCSTPSL